jgi:hypothetical protein
MTAEPHDQTPPRRPERTARAIAAALPEPEASEFREEWRAALAVAAESLDLVPVTELIDQWHVHAVCLSVDPEGHRRALERGRRAAAGELLPGTITVDELRRRLGV